MLIILDYGIGNLSSIHKMFERAGVEARISGDPAEVVKATQLLLPGMGNFDNCMEQFHSSGLRPIVEQKAWDEKIPVLGICVGLQMMMEKSEEGNEKGLGWIKGPTIGFDKTRLPLSCKVPNMGWLNVKAMKTSKLWADLGDSRFYFAHSYFVEPTDREDILLTAEYGYTIPVGIERDNLLGVQFHPEKSHRFGMQLLKNFATNYR